MDKQPASDDHRLWRASRRLATIRLMAVRSCCPWPGESRPPLTAISGDNTWATHSCGVVRRVGGGRPRPAVTAGDLGESGLYARPGVRSSTSPTTCRSQTDPSTTWPRSGPTTDGGQQFLDAADDRGQVAVVDLPDLHLSGQLVQDLDPVSAFRGAALQVGRDQRRLNFDRAVHDSHRDRAADGCPADLPRPMPTRG